MFRICMLLITFIPFSAIAAEKQINLDISFNYSNTEGSTSNGSSTITVLENEGATVEFAGSDNGTKSTKIKVGKVTTINDTVKVMVKFVVENDGAVVFEASPLIQTNNGEEAKIAIQGENNQFELSITPKIVI
ncbi:MAG: hypothetical protein R3B45_09555 [Bdellovibrionota bacterium]